MGYTHYWYLDKKSLPLVEKALPRVVQDFKALLPYLPPLADPMGEGKPVLEPHFLAFNGQAPEDYEAFTFPDLTTESETRPGYLFDFCKTEHRPYDLAVVAALTLLRWHLGSAIVVESDGSLEDFAKGTELVVRVLGYPVDPFFVLGRELVVALDRQRRPLVVEVHPGQEKRELAHLAELAPLFLEGFTPPFQVHGASPPPPHLLKRTRIPGVYLLRRAKEGRG